MGTIQVKLNWRFFFIGEEKVRLFFKSKSLSVDEGVLWKLFKALHWLQTANTWSWCQLYNIKVSFVFAYDEFEIMQTNTDFFLNWIFQPNCFSVFETRHCHKSSKAVYNLQLAIVLITLLRVEYENQELSDSFLFSCRMHLQTVKQNTDTVPQTTQWIATR